MAKKLRILIYGVLIFYGCLLLGFHVYAAQKGQVILIAGFESIFSGYYLLRHGRLLGLFL